MQAKAVSFLRNGIQHDWKYKISGFMLMFPQGMQKH